MRANPGCSCTKGSCESTNSQSNPSLLFASLHHLTIEGVRWVECFARGEGYRGIGLWGKVRGELGEYLGGGFGRETVGNGGLSFGGYGVITPPKSAPMTQAAIRRLIKENVDAAIVAKRARHANAGNDTRGSGPARGQNAAPAARE
ncbi:hypothetical protein Tco_0315803 [Tanacetum coccineum]